MINNYVRAIKKYFDFDGRDSVREYWQFVAMHVVIWLVLILIITFVDLGAVFNMLAYMGYPLFGFTPQVSASVRRLHDTNRSGWWLVP